MTTTADEIRDFLTEHGISQAHLARLLEPTQPSFAVTLNRWARGHQSPPHPHILRLALEKVGADLDGAKGLNDA